MADKLPALVFNPATRTGNEGFIYYNLEQSILLGRLTKNASGTVWSPESSCAGSSVCPTSGFYAARIATPAGAGLTVGGKTFPDSPPVGAALEITVAGDAPEDLTLTGGDIGDTVEIFCMPNPDNDVLICYDQGFSADEGDTRKPIPRKLNPADHYVIQRGDSTLTLSDLFVNNWVGVSRLKGRQVTLIRRMIPNGGGAPVQIDYFTNVMFTKLPQQLPADSNESVTVDAEANFNKALAFAAPAV